MVYINSPVNKYDMRYDSFQVSCTIYFNIPVGVHWLILEITKVTIDKAYCDYWMGGALQILFSSRINRKQARLH